MTTDLDHLDLSWTESHIRTMNSKTILSPELMTNINIHFVYINTNAEIVKVIKENHPLQQIDNKCVLPEHLVLQFIQTKRQDKDTRYKLVDILSFIVTLGSEHINRFTQNNDIIEDFMKTISIPGEIEILPSIIIFHPLNTIYFIFREMVLVTSKPQVISKPQVNSSSKIDPKKTSENAIPSSILKTGENDKGARSKKMTKRVRISDDLPTFKSGTPLSGKTAKIRIL